MAISRNEIGIRFAPPKTDEARNDIKARLSAKAEELALLVHDLVPGSREQSEAISSLEDAVQWAHAGVDRRLVLRGERRPRLAAEPATAEPGEQAAAGPGEG
ncbi:Acb2/Tad1 domain-containing protein [Streptomyces tendae]|uniref:Acb2/Tad1 domain-containing protein n=1 Tax=Streptomyces tendae TaxID=1932 RepID=UPI003443F90C